MYLINALILIILINFDSVRTFSNSPIEISLPFSSEEVYPYFFSYNDKNFLFTSKGVYYIKSNASQYYLQIAYPEYFNDFTINQYTSSFFYIEVDRQTKIVIFPFYNDSIYFKIYSRKTTFYHTLEHSYQFLSGYRPEVQQVDNERFILSGVEEGTRLGILIVFNKDRQFEINVKTSFQLNLNTFSCAYFPFTDRYFCLFSRGYENLFYARYVPDSGFTDEILMIRIEYGSRTSNFKILSTGVRTNIASFINEVKHTIILFHFTVGPDSLSYVENRNTEIYTDNSLEHYVSLFGKKYIIVVGYYNENYECKIFMDNTGFQSLSLSELRHCGENGYQMRLSINNNILNFAYMNKDTNNILFYQHPFIDCTDINIQVKNNKETFYFDVHKLAYMDKYSNDDYSGLYLSISDTLYERGQFLEVDDQGNEIGEITFRNAVHFYKRIKYKPMYPYYETYYYIIYFRITDSFYFPSPSCTLTIQGNCYDSCSDCNFMGNDTDHQCKGCKDNYYYIENTNNCHTGQIPYYYFDTENSIYKGCPSNCLVCSNDSTCSQCEEGYSFKSEFTNNPMDAYCIKYSNNYYYIDEDNNIVFLEANEKCPIKYPCLNVDNKRCYSSNEMNQTDCNIMLLSNKTIKEIEEYIDENAVNLYNEEYSHTRYENSFLIYDSFNTTNKGVLTEISLLECEERIREQYSIKEEDYFLIGHVEYFDERDVYYYLYLNNGTSIDISICNNTTVRISQDIYEEDLTLDKEQIKELIEKNINVFNMSDPFFNDKCYSFSDNKRDIPLTERRIIYYQNITSKKDNCEFTQSDMNTFRLIFICNVNEDSLNKNILSFTGLHLNPSFSSISESVFDLLKCIDKVDISSLFKSIGSIIMLIMVIIQTFLMSVYLCQINKLIKEYLDSEEEIEIDNKESIEEINKKNKSNIFIYEKPIIRIINRNEKSNKMDLSTLTYSNSFSFDSIKTKEKITDFDRLDFIGAILFDKRNCFSVFISRMKMFNCLYIICTNEHNKIKPVVLSSSLYLFSLCFFFNSFFFNNSYISYLYYNGYHFSMEIKKYLLSSFISISIKVLIELSLVTHLPRKKEIKDFSEKLKCISIMKKNNSILFIIVILTTIFFWLYVALFCCLYNKTQKYMIYGSVITFIINIMLSIFAALICSVLRVIAVRTENELLFDVENFIEIC